jgi:hypothetical protein
LRIPLVGGELDSNAQAAIANWAKRIDDLARTCLNTLT